jgi:hypothetical protein
LRTRRTKTSAGSNTAARKVVLDLVGALTDNHWQGREHVFAEHARDAILTGSSTR